jgi:hypothetical protein
VIIGIERVMAKRKIAEELRDAPATRRSTRLKTVEKEPVAEEKNVKTAKAKAMVKTKATVKKSPIKDEEIEGGKEEKVRIIFISSSIFVLSISVLTRSINCGVADYFNFIFLNLKSHANIFTFPPPQLPPPPPPPPPKQSQRHTYFPIHLTSHRKPKPHQQKPMEPPPPPMHQERDNTGS